MPEDLKVVVVGCGTMGASHARAYRSIEGFELAGVVSRGPSSREALARELDATPFASLDQALAAVAPQVVSINTHPDSHHVYAMQALAAGCHLFVEKPLAETVEQAEEIVSAARDAGRKVVVGYILRHHPSWRTFIEHARRLGRPLVMRMNLNQQSSAERWLGHRNLMRSMSPIVDCGVHYVDVMSRMTGARPVRVQAVGARLSGEIAEDMYNYGQLQVTFDDGSVGWYEAGWGPMMSEVAFFVKDVVGPKGCVSIVMPQEGQDHAASDDIDSHTKTNALLCHSSEIDEANNFVHEDEWVDMADEPSHQELCDREQAFLLKAIREDLDLSEHMESAVNSLRIVIAADESIKRREVVHLG